MSVQTFSSDDAPDGSDVEAGRAATEFTRAASDAVDTSDDGALVLAARDGDAGAFDLLVRRHADRLLRMVRTLTNSREDAEDVTQEALAAAYFKLESFAGRSSFFTWLYRIALNKAISRRRLRRIETTRSSQPWSETLPPADDQPTAVDVVQREEEVERLREAIGRLETDRQRVLVLRDVESLDYSEIAEILNIPIGTVRSRLHRARSDLRQILGASDAATGGGPST